MNDETWFGEGLRFGCTRCGLCCGGGPGTIRVNDDEIEKLAARLGLSDESFRERYTRRLRGGDITLIEKKDYDCIFHDRETGCGVYTDRPRQCRTWPFWRSIVDSRENWDDAAAECPGMNSGRRYGPDEIATTSADDGTSESPR